MYIVLSFANEGGNKRLISKRSGYLYPKKGISKDIILGNGLLSALQVHPEPLLSALVHRFYLTTLGAFVDLSLDGFLWQSHLYVAM